VECGKREGGKEDEIVSETSRISVVDGYDVYFSFS
jgi:hypothetical protein